MDVCVVTLVYPVILLNKEVLKQLTDLELYIILGHELMHIKRKHHLLRRMFDVVSAIQWFNPIVWIEKNSFELICEMDCDKYTISKLKGAGSNSSMIHLCELSLEAKTELLGGIEAAGKNFIQQRFIAIYQRRSGRKKNIYILISRKNYTHVISNVF